MTEDKDEVYTFNMSQGTMAREMFLGKNKGMFGVHLLSFLKVGHKMHHGASYWKTYLDYKDCFQQD